MCKQTIQSYQFKLDAINESINLINAFLELQKQIVANKKQQIKSWQLWKKEPQLELAKIFFVSLPIESQNKLNELAKTAELRSISGTTFDWNNEIVSPGFPVGYYEGDFKEPLVYILKDLHRHKAAIERDINEIRKIKIQFLLPVNASDPSTRMEDYKNQAGPKILNR